MATGLICSFCGKSFDGRSDRRWCTQECRTFLKTLYDKTYHSKNRDVKIRRACEWQIQNKERKRQYDKARRESLPKRPRPKSKEDPQVRRQISAKRRAAKLNHGAYTVTRRDMDRALARVEGRCTYCSGRFSAENPMEWDHVVPISRGGSHSIGNLVPACRDCNRHKQVKFLSEWRHGRIVSIRNL